MSLGSSEQQWPAGSRLGPQPLRTHTQRTAGLVLAGPLFLPGRANIASGI